MTSQYLVGEVARLRREAETCPPPELSSVLRGALRVADAAADLLD